MLRFVIASVMLAMLGACSGSDDPMDDGPDAGGDASVNDASMNDATTDDGDVPDASVNDISFTGTVYVFDATDIGNQTETPWDGGAVTGPAVAAGGRVFQADVRLYDLSGTQIDSDTTDELGRYTLTAPPNTLTHLEVRAFTNYGGLVRVEQTRGDDYEAYDISLPIRMQMEEVMTAADTADDMATLNYDASKGWIVVGINAVDRSAEYPKGQLGGEGATIADGASTAGGFNLSADGGGNTVMIKGNRLVTICNIGDGLAPDGGYTSPECVDYRDQQIFFPLVTPGLVEVTPLNPLMGACQLRFDVPSYLVSPDAYTVVNVDCPML